MTPVFGFVLVQPKLREMKTYSVKIDEELAAKIANQAKKEDRSESSVIRQALRFFFLKIKVQPKSIKTPDAPQN